VTFSITIPPNTPSGPYLITVVGVNAAGVVIPSAKFTVESWSPDGMATLTTGLPATALTGLDLHQLDSSKEFH